MDNKSLASAFSSLSTPLIADACIRANVPLRVAAIGIRPLTPEMRVAGRVLPARHRGSVDIFLEVIRKAQQGDVLVIDNEARTDESCIGDLTVLEAKASGLAALIVRGLHRDTTELVRIGFPIFSYGSYPGGPRRLDQRTPRDLTSAQWDSFTVSNNDVVFADDDGIIFVPSTRIEKVIEAAQNIWKVERQQAKSIQAGKKLSEQFDFDSYLAKRKSDASYTLRKHLRERGGAVEE